VTGLGEFSLGIFNYAKRQPLWAICFYFIKSQPFWAIFYFIKSQPFWAFFNLKNYRFAHFSLNT
jgi:hypothetical protein